MTHWKSPWCWERSRGGEEGVRGWDGWTASPMQWTWIWANSGRWWGTGGHGVLQSMGLQRVGHDWLTEQQQQQELLGQMATLCLTVWEAIKLSSRVVVPFYISIGKAKVFISPQSHQHLLLSDFLVLAILVDVKWYVIKVLTCISLRTSAIEHLSYAYGLIIYLWKFIQIICPFNLKLT